MTDVHQPTGCTLRHTLTGHTKAVGEVVWSPDGTRLASASDDTTVRIWRAADGALLQTLTGHTDWVRDVAWSLDGTRLASASHDGTVRIWRAADGALRHTLTGHTKAVVEVVWSPDGTWLASASDDATVRLWAPHTGQCCAVLPADGVAIHPTRPDLLATRRRVTDSAHDIDLWELDLEQLQGRTSQDTSG